MSSSTNVRSLLQTERLARRINHPHASYTSNGTLMCQVCQTLLKADSLWEPHLRGRPHAIQLQRAQSNKNPVNSTDPLTQAEDQKTAQSASNGRNGKKRKASDDEEDLDDSRKKAKPAAPVPRPPLETTLTDRSGSQTVGHSANTKPSAVEEPPEPSTAQPAGTTTNIDEDEWAAFQRDVATPPPETSTVPAAVTAAATISAAPITAEEIAARAREEASTQARERREAEIEGEKEDAARQLEEEFDEMEELESRVRRLREKREALRKLSEAAKPSVDAAHKGVDEGGGAAEGDEDSEDSMEDDDDGFGGWGLR